MKGTGAAIHRIRSLSVCWLVGCCRECGSAFCFSTGLLKNKTGDVASAMRFFNLAIQKCEESLNSNPNHKLTLRYSFPLSSGCVV
jgi:hypothetical protein